MLQRHLIIDHLLEKYLSERGVKQVIELACGLSPRGFRLMNNNKNSDILSESGDLSLENIAKKYLRPGIPTAIITDGLINYFDMETLTNIWKRISHILTSFNGGVYLSDNLSHKTDHLYYFMVKIWTKMVGLAASGKFHMHFYPDSESEETFRDIGFREINIHHPETYLGVLPIFLSSQPALITVIEAVI